MPDARISTLSDDSRKVAAAWFGMMLPGKGQLTLHLRESKPTPRAQAGLDELVAAGLISVEPFNQYGGLVYRPLVSFEELHREVMMKVLFDENIDAFHLTEPIPTKD